MTFVVEFLPSTGSPKAYFRINNLAIPQTKSASDIIIIIVELIVCVYVLLEFLFRELTEVRVSFSLLIDL